MDFPTHKAMLVALEAGTATPDQQREVAAYIVRLKQSHNRELREADRDARDAYHEGRANEAAASRGEPPGCY